jgi:hypothetical protein
VSSLGWLSFCFLGVSRRFGEDVNSPDAKPAGPEAGGHIAAQDQMLVSRTAWHRYNF